MKQRDAVHYYAMIELNESARIGANVAARMIRAAEGHVDPPPDPYLTRELMAEHGESLLAADVRRRMLSAELRARRERAGLTQAQAADLLHVSQPYIGDVERGRRTPSDTLMDLARLKLGGGSNAAD